jgi:hypothetical protein
MIKKKKCINLFFKKESNVGIFFAYMAIDSLPGNQFWERILLVFVTPTSLCNQLWGFAEFWCYRSAMKMMIAIKLWGYFLHTWLLRALSHNGKLN